MNRVTLLAFAVMASLTISAAERTEKEMAAIAQKKLNQMTRITRSGTTEKMTKLLDSDQYGIYGTNNGFVVVSKSREQTPVLGYSNTPYQADRVPCGMQWWLATVSATMEQTTITTTPITRAEAVEPLLKTEWGQGNPFNLLCPVLEGEKTPSGCVATAMAQVVNYFRYPETGKGVSSYTVLGGFRPWTLTYGTTYRYDLLKEKYDSATVANLTDEEKTAISTFLLHCGGAVNMNYNADGSGANTFDAANGLATYLRYDSLAIHSYNREFFTNEEWMTMLRKELAANHPVLYAGHDSRGYGGHAFVIDGINAEGMVHVNWGWDGDCNGYYSIDGLTPKRSVGFSNSYNFSSGQLMIVGYKLQENADAEDSYSSFWATGTPYTLTISGNNFLIKNIGGMYNYNWLPFDGTVALIFEEDKENGQQYQVSVNEDQLGSYQGISHWGYGYDELESVPFARVNDVQMPAGNYKVYLGSKDVKETRFRPLRCGGNAGSIYYQVTKGGDSDYTVESEYKRFQMTTTTGVRDITVSRPQSNIIYDLQGRSWGTDSNDLPRGIYIIDGKKVVK